MAVPVFCIFKVKLSSIFLVAPAVGVKVGSPCIFTFADKQSLVEQNVHALSAKGLNKLKNGALNSKVLARVILYC